MSVPSNLSHGTSLRAVATLLVPESHISQSEILGGAFENISTNLADAFSLCPAESSS